MGISKDNIACTAYLNKDIVEIIDKLASDNLRTRSTQVSYMLQKYLEMSGEYVLENGKFTLRYK